MAWNSIGADKPIRALIITGGCCHNYAFQSQAITPMLRAQLQLGTEVPLPFRAATPSAPR